MTKYEIRTNQKKAAIIEAAKELFSSKGFINVSIKEIADKAHVSQVSIYNYFGSKEALVGEYITQLMENTLQSAHEILQKPMDFKTKIIKALSLCNTELSLTLNEYFSPQALEDQTFIRLVYESINEKKLDLFREYIEMGKKEGIIPPLLSTSTILSHIEALTSLTTSSPSSSIEELHHLFLFGILGQ